MQKVIKVIKDCVAAKTCCEETGVDCNQGRTCPVREGTQKPSEAVHQIKEPLKITAIDALREAEAALEVAMARILKADPGHSVSVTSEAKALVAVRQALSAQAAPVAVGEREAFVALKLSELDAHLLKDARQALWAIAQTYDDYELRLRAQERLERIDEQRCVGRESILNNAALDATPAAGFDVRKSDNNAAAPVVLPEQDATLLNQGVELLHALSNDERNRGNCSAAEGATASAHAVQRLAALLATGGQAQANPENDFPHEEFDAIAATRYKVVAADQSMFWEWAVVAGDGTQQLYVGRKVDCENIARKFAGAFADGAFSFHALHAAPQAQADARDAESDYRRGYRHGYNQRDAEVKGALV